MQRKVPEQVPGEARGEDAVRVGREKCAPAWQLIDGADHFAAGVIPRAVEHLCDQAREGRAWAPRLRPTRTHGDHQQHARQSGGPDERRDAATRRRN
eukprot:3960445-Prymnesium_polylepis.1